MSPHSSDRVSLFSFEVTGGLTVRQDILQQGAPYLQHYSMNMSPTQLTDGPDIQQLQREMLLVSHGLLKPSESWWTRSFFSKPVLGMKNSGQLFPYRRRYSYYFCSNEWCPDRVPGRITIPSWAEKSPGRLIREGLTYPPSNWRQERHQLAWDGTTEDLPSAYESSIVLLDMDNAVPASISIEGLRSHRLDGCVALIISAVGEDDPDFALRSLDDDRSESDSETEGCSDSEDSDTDLEMDTDISQLAPGEKVYTSNGLCPNH